MLTQHPSLCNLLLTDTDVYDKLLYAYNGFTNDAIIRSNAFDWVSTMPSHIAQSAPEKTNSNQSLHNHIGVKKAVRQTKHTTGGTVRQQNNLSSEVL